jgi:hypothetical protein
LDYLGTTVTALSAFITTFVPTDFAAWNPGGNAVALVTSDSSYPITNAYGYLTNYASQLTLSNTPTNLWVANTGVTLEKIYTARVWVKLGTASNFCLCFNNTLGWNTIGCKSYTAADGLNATTYTLIQYTFVGPASGFVNMHIGAHGQTNVTQQTPGTVFVYGWQIFVADATTTFNGNIACAGASFWGTVSGISKTMVGLGNVDNVADVSKPVSTATQIVLDSKQARNLNESYITSTITATSPFYTSFTPTDFPPWTSGKANNFTNDTSYPITNYGVVSNYASQLTLTSNTTTWDLSLNGLALASGRSLTVSMWVKLGTATNFAMAFNNTAAWNTASGKTFTSSDGLNTSTYTRVSLTTAAPSNGTLNFLTGCHLQSGQAQQSGGTVFTYGWQMVINDNTCTLTSNVVTSGYIKSAPMCFFGRLVTNMSSYTAGSPFAFSTLVDPYSRWSVANKLFTASVAGYYQVAVSLATGGSINATDISIYKNGTATTFLARYTQSASYNTCGSGIIALAVGDYIQIAGSASILLNLDLGTLTIRLM